MINFLAHFIATVASIFVFAVVFYVGLVAGWALTTIGAPVWTPDFFAVLGMALFILVLWSIEE